MDELRTLAGSIHPAMSPPRARPGADTPSPTGPRFAGRGGRPGPDRMPAHRRAAAYAAGERGDTTGGRPGRGRPPGCACMFKRQRRP